MHTVNLTIKKNYVKQDGTTPIYIQYNISRSIRRLIKIGKSVQPEFWNTKTKEIRRSHPEYLQLNSFLKIQKNKFESIIDAYILQGKELNPDRIISDFEGQEIKQAIKDKSLIDHLDDFMEQRKTEVVKDVRKDYGALRKHLVGYQKKRGKRITFIQIDYAFYKGFVNYLEYHAVQRNGTIGLQKNSVGKLIKNLKVFLRHCMKFGICEHIDLTEFKVFTVPSVSVYVKEEELDRLLDIDLSCEHTKREAIRDLFIVGCETGLRYSDFSRLTKDYIHGEFIRIYMKKTIRPVVIPISKRLRKIIDKYDGAFPKVKNSMIFNSEIKHICKLARIDEYVISIKQFGNQRIEERKRKYEMISTHTCRRSFCTNQFLKGVPAGLIRKISGHSDEKSFLRYIRINEEESAEKMLQLWKELE